MNNTALNTNFRVRVRHGTMNAATVAQVVDERLGYERLDRTNGVGGDHGYRILWSYSVSAVSSWLMVTKRVVRTISYFGGIIRIPTSRSVK